MITNVESSASFKPYIKASPYLVKTQPFFPEKYFEDYLSAHSEDVLSKILLLRIYCRNGKKYAAHKILSQLKREAAHNTLFSELAITTAKIDINPLAESREKESIKTFDPESVSGLWCQYDDAIIKEKWDNAISLVPGMMKNAPEN